MANSIATSGKKKYLEDYNQIDPESNSAQVYILTEGLGTQLDRIALHTQDSCTPHKPNHAWNPSTWKVEAEDQEFKDILNYVMILRPARTT